MNKRLLLVLAMIIALTTPALMAGEIIHDAEPRLSGDGPKDPEHREMMAAS